MRSYSAVGKEGHPAICTSIDGLGEVSEKNKYCMYDITYV